MAKHSELTTADGIHKPYSYEYANSNARDTATGFVAGDIGKLCYVSDTGVISRLKAVSPSIVWEEVVQGTELAAHTASILNPHGVTAGQVALVSTPTNYTASSNNVLSHFEGVDTALGGLSGGSPDGGVNAIQVHDGAGEFDGAGAKATSAGEIWFPEISAPGTPTSGYGTVYAKSDSKLYFKDDSGTETELTGGGGGGGGSPGGSSGQIQYNDGAGAFAGSAAQVTSAGSFTLPEVSAPSTPSSGFASIYISDDPNSAAAAPPRIHTKDSAGLERTLYPAIERLGVGNAQSNNERGSFRLGPKDAETTASFTNSTTDFLVMGLVRFGPTVIPQVYTDSNRKPLFFLVYRGGYASGMDAVYFFDENGTAYMRNTSNAKTTKNRDTVGESVGMFVFHQTQWLNNHVYKGIGIGHVGMSLNMSTGTPAFVDYSSAGSEHEGGSIEFQITAGSSLLALGVCDNRAASAGAGWHPFSANAPSAFSTVQEANIAYMKAHDIFMREGTIRNLTSAEIGGSNPLEWDKLYLPSDATVDSDGAITAWPKNSASADTSAPNITLLGSGANQTFRYPVTWYPQS